MDSNGGDQANTHLPTIARGARQVREREREAGDDDATVAVSMSLGKSDLKVALER